MSDPLFRPLIQGIGVAVQDLSAIGEILVAISDQSDSKAFKHLILLALTRVEHAVSVLNLEQIFEAPPIFPRPPPD